MKYFVSYFISRNNNGNSGFGNTVIEIDEKIKDIDDLNSIKKYIESNRNFKDVIILYYQKMQ